MKKSALSSDVDVSQPVSMYTEIYKSGIGDLYIGASDHGLRFISLLKEAEPIINSNEYTAAAIHQLVEYFAGERESFDIKLDLNGYSDFSIRVWQKLLCIPHGKTISYLQLAKEMEDVKCIRAAASANGRNPIPIIIPCHRVIGSDGSLTGFALGLDIKRQLLAIENPTRYKNNQISLDF
jgi:methylated-DNA-[protein]-cysteine S-methyltransferase